VARALRQLPLILQAFVIAWVLHSVATQFPGSQAQTTDYVGFPDPHYSTTRAIKRFSCIGGRKNCPDNGEYIAAGGNLTLTIVEMRNLPDLDGFGLAGLETDAFIEARIGDNVRRSGTIMNSLNPVWAPCQTKGCVAANETKRDLNFGFRPAGTPITIRVYDEDDGLEFDDDLIAEIAVNAIYCSAFTALTQRVASDEDSAWHMPEQPLCVEEMWLPLVASSEPCEVDGVVTHTVPCMRLRMTTLPFQMKTEQVFVTNITINGGMGGYFENVESWLYGRVFSSSGTQLASYFRMDRAKGGLLVRSGSTLNNHKGNTSLIPTYGYAPLGRVTFNFDAEVFIFRRIDDAASQPEWLQPPFGWAPTREYAQLVGVVGDYVAVARNVTAHTKNKYGDALGAGLVTGANLAQNYTDKTLSMYFIVAQPHESFDLIPATFSKEFSRTAFVVISLQFAPTFFIVLTLVVRYMRRMNWRIERVQSFLAEKVIDEDDDPLLQLLVSSTNDRKDKKGVKADKPNKPGTVEGGKAAKQNNTKSLHAGRDIVASLFLCYKQSPRNLDFRRNLLYASCAIYLICAMPILLLIAWGVATIVLVTPPAFGFGLIFLGIGGLGTTYALLRWRRMGWRMTDAVLSLFAIAFASAFVFLFTATFADPRVFIGGQNVDFFSLSCVFLTLNMMPMLWIAFTNDAKLSKSLTQVLAVVGASKKVNALKTKFKNLGTMGLKFASAKANDQQQQQQTTPAAGLGGASRRARKESVFAPLMGDHYSVEQTIPGFNRADILQNAFVTSPEKKRQANRRFYGAAVMTLVVYSFVACVRSDYPSQAIGISVTIVLVDLCIYMLYRGNLTWSAGYTVFLMGSVRVCLAATSGRYWILGHAFLYMVFGTALCREIIGKNLPRMNKHEAGGVTFFGHEHAAWHHLDVSTTPEFVLGFLSFCYVFLLLAVAFGTDGNDTIRVPVCGQQWPLWVFGVLAFIVVLFTGLTLATSRAFFLQKEQLLSEYATKVYLFFRAFKLPFMLAAASEVLVICSGLFVYASTRSSFILVTSVFGPLLMMLSLAVYAQWRKNDYRLVIWPPEQDEEDFLDDDEDEDFDEEKALEKEAELMRETFVLPPLKGRSTTTFFDGNDETFKMPALPAKSSLQAKFLQKPQPATNEENPKAANSNSSLLARARLLQQQQNSKTKSGTASPEFRALPGVAESETTTGITMNPTAMLSPKAAVRPRRFAMLRDFFQGRLRFRELFAKATWRKYQQVNQLTEPGLSPPGSARALLLQADGSSSPDLVMANSTPIDFATMSLYQACRQGFLLPHDYVTLSCFALLLGLLFLYGMILTITETPAWLGQLLWVGAYVVVFSVFPTVKYFKIAGVTQDMKFAFGASYLVAWISGFIFFFAVMHADVNRVESLVILSILVFYPIFLLFIVTLCQWKDSNWEITRPLKRTIGFCGGVIMLWIIEMYIYGGVLLGGVLTCLALLFLFITFFLVKYVENDMYLSPKYQRLANRIIVGVTVVTILVGFQSGLSFFFCLSVIFIVLLLKYAMHFCAAWVFGGREELSMFYAPYVFPAFSYNAYTNNVVDENRNVRFIYLLLLILFAWGVSGVMFFDPLGFGIGLCSLVLLVFASVTAHLCAVTPVKMGIAAKYVNEMILKDASEASKKVAHERRKPFTLECTEFIELEKREKKAELEFQAIAYGGGVFAKQKKKIDTVTEPEKNLNDDQSVPHRSSGEVAMEIDALERSCRVMTEEGIDVPLCDGLFTIASGLQEIWDLGVGPFGFLYAFTIPMRVMRYLKWRYFPSKRDRARAAVAVATQEEALVAELDALEKGSRLGTSSSATVTSTCTDLVGILIELPVLDEELDHSFYEETRCIIHFQLLLLNAADARLSREKILFQKFLRENRFKLMSNGINPPPSIFKTSSFASIDIPLVAVWLLSLTPEERARFHALKASFNDEMERMDAIVDAEDAQSKLQQRSVREAWKPLEDAQCRKRMQEFYARRLRREDEGISLDANQDEALVNAQEVLLEIESGFSCVPGAYGRALQFVDREFPPDETSVANVACASELGGWQVSTAINVVAGLFDGGTDPDDVHVGKLNDAWLLSAISILAASGGVDDGKVDALIDRLFITKQTSLTGAYALRLFKNAQWETVIVDDYFPVLAGGDAAKSSASAGAAFAHSRDFEELWVPLLEKAFAKYHGGYAALESGGFVHHALTELSGFASHEICLAPASRGTLKQTLWTQLLQYKANKFLMGAGTISSESADTEILDTGLVFGACYVVYDVRAIDGFQLLQLRNPPGDHAEWKGDWSDHSKLWTRRLKKRLGWRADADGDNTFWMSFDDFCHAFRSLYVCQYYDPAKWPIQIRHGAWTRETACGLPTRHNADCTLEGNPQFSLGVTRPTEVLLTVTQVDQAGLAPVDVLPIAMYVVAQGHAKDRALRVKTLTRDTVVAHSGEPTRAREVRVQCSLDARAYTVLVAAYKKGMEGPFTLTVQTNYAVALEQLWPATWKEGATTNLLGAVAESSAVAKLREKKKELVSKLAAGAAVVDSVLGDEESVLRLGVAKKKEEEEEQREREATTASKSKKAASASPWLEQWDDASGKPFYFNKQTGVSSWDKPPDF
jgi:hypothetical protein